MRRRSLLLFLLMLAASCGDDAVATSTTTSPDAGVDAAVSDANAPAPDATSVPPSDGGTCARTDLPPAEIAAREKAYCDALASRSACSGGADTCDAQGKCIYGRLMLANVFDAYNKCRAAPSCKGDDACLGVAVFEAEGPAATKFQNDCTARRTECANAFAAERCAPAYLAYTCGAVEATACLSKPCADIDACIKALPLLQAIAACK